MKKRFRPVVVLALVLSVLAGILFRGQVTAAAAPSLFHNDERWYRDTSVFLERVGEVYYIPVDIFGMYNHIELTIDGRRGEFMVYNRTTGRYITVLYNEKIATVDGEEEVYLNLYRLHGGYYYVPAEFFCSVLSMSCEILPSSSPGYGVSLRICDGNQTKPFGELLSSYDPSDASSTAESTSETETTPPPITSENDDTRRVNYLTFNTISADTFTDVLAALRKARVSAAFFISEEEMRAYPERVISIVTGGHTVALRCGSAVSAEEFLSRMDSANRRLYSLTKTTSHIAQLPGGTKKAGLSEAELEKIQAAGYVLWDWTYDVPDSMGYRVSYVLSVCRREILSGERNVLRMSCNDTVAQLLPDLIEFLQSSSNYQIRKITVSEAEIRFFPA